MRIRQSEGSIKTASACRGDQLDPTPALRATETDERAAVGLYHEALANHAFRVQFDVLRPDADVI
jgi:hypothetical protein